MKSRYAVTLAAALSVASFALVHAQQPRAQQTPAQPATPQTPAPPAPAQGPTKPFIPLVASTLADHADRYYGEPVTVTATVEQILSPAVFSLDQDKTKSTGKEVLVVAPTMIGIGKVDLNTYVTVIGEVVKFDPAEISKKTKGYTLDLGAEAAEKFKNKPVIVATSVVTVAGIDVAKRPPPPMTADELALQKVMRQIQPASTALRGAVDAMNVAAAKEQAAILKTTFAQTEAFWKPKGKADAIQWSADGKKDAETVEAAVTAGNWDQARASAATLNQKCAACHTAYRDRMDDGTFRIKPSR